MRSYMLEVDTITPDLIGKVVSITSFPRKACTVDYREKTEIVGQLVSYKEDRDGAVVRIEGMEPFAITHKYHEATISVQVDNE